jgi:hypothetical protein
MMQPHHRHQTAPTWTRNQCEANDGRLFSLYNGRFPPEHNRVVKIKEDGMVFIFNDVR